MGEYNNDVKKVTGVMILEAVMSNPNGDPDNEGAPRVLSDGRGHIHNVSIHRKIRDIVDDKEGVYWKEIKQKHSDEDTSKSADKETQKPEYAVFEQRGVDDNAAVEMLKEENGVNKFLNKYWDVRVFGSTFLQEGNNGFTNTGVCKVFDGLSIAPIISEPKTMTTKKGKQEGKDRGMAPGAYKVVEHAVYVVPFEVNPADAHKTQCTQKDVDIFLAALPYVYDIKSLVRKDVRILNAFAITHKKKLGSIPSHEIFNFFKPKKLTDISQPSTSLDEYELKTLDAFKEAYAGRFEENGTVDLVEERYK